MLISKLVYELRNDLYRGFLSPIIEMDTYTLLFWLSSILFATLSAYLVCCTKKTNIFYAQIASGCGMFVTSKIGRKFLGLE